MCLQIQESLRFHAVVAELLSVRLSTEVAQKSGGSGALVCGFSKEGQLRDRQRDVIRLLGAGPVGSTAYGECQPPNCAAFVEP